MFLPKAAKPNHIDSLIGLANAKDWESTTDPSIIMQPDFLLAVALLLLPLLNTFDRLLPVPKMKTKSGSQTMSSKTWIS